MPDALRNKEILKDVYRRWHETRGGCVDDILGICDDAVAFGSLAEGAEPLAFTAAVTGKERLRSNFNGLLGSWEMIRYIVDELVGEDDRVVAIGSTAWRNRATGKSVETPKVDVWRFKDGRVTEFFEYYDTAKLMAASVGDGAPSTLPHAKRRGLVCPLTCVTASTRPRNSLALFRGGAVTFAWISASVEGYP